MPGRSISELTLDTEDPKEELPQGAVELNSQGLVPQIKARENPLDEVAGARRDRQIDLELENPLQGPLTVGVARVDGEDDVANLQ